jgi:hypothetical protein
MRALPALTLASAALLLAACGSTPACPAGGCGGGGGGCAPVSIVNLPTLAVVASGDGPAIALAVDADKIYWSVDAAVIDRADKTGGSVTQLGVGVLAESLVVDGDRLLAMSGNEEIVAVPKDGTPTTTLVTGQTGAGFSGQASLAVDATAIYWVGAGDTQKTGPSHGGYVRRSDKDGANVVDLATGRGFAMTILVEGGSIYWAEAGSIDDQGMVQKDGSVNRVPVGGGAVEKLAGGLGSPRILGRRGGELWLISDGNLMRLPDGGEPTFVYSGVSLAAISATDVFFVETVATNSRTLLLRAPLAGGCPRPLGELQFPSIPPVIDDVRVYLSEGNSLILSIDQ